MRIATSFRPAAAMMLASIGALLAGSALATPSLVIDAESGRVLHAEQATDPWYPASITKLMTTYVVLKEVDAGRLTLDTPLIVSPRAAAVIPSKMGFKPGTEVTVDNALKMLLVKSANDMAVLLAEGAGGTVEGFADMMNREAARLGMRESLFVNPNGLPDERQRTSARDMAILARALLTDFPRYEGYFGIGAIKFGKRVMQNTNGLIGRYPGADGMKTGFICASGFNVVATATRNGRRLIAVVLGSPTATERTIKAADLFDKGFSGFSGWTGPLVSDLQTAYATTPPDMREEVCGKNRRGPAGEEDGEMASPVSASAGGNGDAPAAFFLSQAATLGGNSVTGINPRTLGPRAKAVPIPVFAGRAPGSSAQPPASMLANRVPPEGKGRKPATAQGFAPSETPPTGGAPVALQGAIDDAPRPGAATAIRPGGAKAKAGPKPGAIAAKPETKPDTRTDTNMQATARAKPAGKAEAKAAPRAKPAASGPTSKATSKPSPRPPAAAIE
ncbi:serine hydrolase [Chelatococcus sp. SYSU_G07232]|uniref:Serine hydrolase n=1 Tax=Chelatococcus albus TaxID=3047466 RepID=A0ABT7AFI7_9HYPH|nr:serine hydrolase [Chelatococcus sp. SYSU_G07232]MDJ1157391.1 serine hydrolase [Chelatococcus sp. SYSU_G07232]